MRIQSSAYLAHLSKIREIGNFRILPTFSNTYRTWINSEKLLSPIDCRLVHVRRYGSRCRFDSMVHHSEMSEARQVTVVPTNLPTLSRSAPLFPSYCEITGGTRM